MPVLQHDSSPPSAAHDRLHGVRLFTARSGGVKPYEKGSSRPLEVFLCDLAGRAVEETPNGLLEMASARPLPVTMCGMPTIWPPASPAHGARRHRVVAHPRGTHRFCSERANDCVDLMLERVSHQEAVERIPFCFAERLNSSLHLAPDRPRVGRSAQRPIDNRRVCSRAGGPDRVASTHARPMDQMNPADGAATVTIRLLAERHSRLSWSLAPYVRLVALTGGALERKTFAVIRDACKACPPSNERPRYRTAVRPNPRIHRVRSGD
jgi:hypothetical protein